MKSLKILLSAARSTAGDANISVNINVLKSNP